MSRMYPWRRVCSDIASWNQDQAISSTLYIVREVGPAGFHLKEDNCEIVNKTFLGNPHSCSCCDFKKNKEICKHICWLLLKKFKLSRNDPVSWQKGLIEREINDIILGKSDEKSTVKKPVVDHNSNELKQRDITEEDVCPICQDGLLTKKLPLTFCRYGCGNSTHLKCMKVWADHQHTNGEVTIKCPFCRENFGSYESIKLELYRANSHNYVIRNECNSIANTHFGVTCNGCFKDDFTGKCYRCIVCDEFFLCQACFNTPLHEEHQFQFRQKRTQRWRTAIRPSCWSMSGGLAADIQNRDLTESDYDLLALLDRPGQVLSTLSVDDLTTLPQLKVKDLSQVLVDDVSCQLCNETYHLGQNIRYLPCSHKFHRECIDPWLLHAHITCPTCGSEVKINKRKSYCKKVLNRNDRSVSSADNNISTKEKKVSDLFVPGMGIKHLQTKSVHQPDTDQTSSVHINSSTQQTINEGQSILEASANSLNLDSNDKEGRNDLTSTFYLKSFTYKNDKSSANRQIQSAADSRSRRKRLGHLSSNLNKSTAVYREDVDLLYLGNNPSTQHPQHGSTAISFPLKVHKVKQKSSPKCLDGNNQEFAVEGHPICNRD